MRRKVTCIFITLLILLCFVGVASASSVSVKIPDFNVYVNQQLVNQQQSAYPLLVHNDVTYFPITWNYSQALGLKTAWDAVNGFSVSKGDSNNSSLNQDLRGNNNLNSNYLADIPQFNVLVNGKIIDNQNLQYPLLVFRDITYFPMTWDYAVTEFGLVTNWDNSKGFSIGKSNINGFPAGAATQQISNSNSIKTTVPYGYGNIKGNITYQYNEFIGSRGDVGAGVVLLNKNATPGSINYDPKIGMNGDFTASSSSDVYYLIADGYGHYEVNNIPTGEYVIVIQSMKAKTFSHIVDPGFDSLTKPLFGTSYSTFRGGFTSLFKHLVDTVTIQPNTTLDYSHDFGYSE